MGVLVGTAANASQARVHVFYVLAEGDVVAQLSRTEPDVSTALVEYLHGDHLGSASFSTDENGVASERVFHDPYGNRFDPAAMPRLDGALLSGVPGVTVGFTGHEMELEDLGLVNMKGRMFDPVNGRFITADPIVQSPEWGQSYNRYMYVMGNPMTYLDPSGFFSCAASPSCGVGGINSEEAFYRRLQWGASVAYQAELSSWAENDWGESKVKRGQSMSDVFERAVLKIRSGEQKAPDFLTELGSQRDTE